MTNSEQPDRTQQLGEYRNFISQVNIQDICIVSANMKSFGTLGAFRQDLTVNYKVAARYENEESGFVAFHQYDVTLKSEKEKKRLARLSVTFGVHYVSKIPMSDQIFDRFHQLNLPLNTWPYFREFTHNSLARMNLSQVIAPVFVPPRIPTVKQKRQGSRTPK